MRATNVNELDIDQMLTRSEVTAGILRVVYALHEIGDYKKEDAVKELVKLLDQLGYLDNPLEVTKGRF